MPAHKIKPKKKKCRRCGKVFLVGGRGRPRYRQQYCSGRCQAFARIIQAKLAHLSKMDAAYFAGLFDGEGSVVLWDRGYGGRLQLRCTISNTWEPLMVWLQKVAGTGSVVRHVHPKATGYKDSLAWQVYGQNAVRLLRRLLPFLIVKKTKAIEAIASQSKSPTT
jgi:hypothetical protein